MKKNWILLFCCLNLIAYGQQDFFAKSKTTNKDLRINSFVKGSLLQPRVQSNVLAIIIPGSGPTDRDGNQQFTRNDALKKLAEGLAEDGIASFRFDKRVLTLLEQGVLDEKKFRFEDFVTDVVSVVHFFKQRSSYSAIFLIGHSQGSLVGALTSQEIPVTGFISLAGAGQSIDRTIINQIKLQQPGLEKKAEVSFAELIETGRVRDYDISLDAILNPDTQAFMVSWMRYDPSEEIKKVTVPILIIGGSKDLQSSKEEFLHLVNARPDAAQLYIQGMNHVFRMVTGNNLENAKTYNQPNRPIAPTLLTTVVNFIKKHS